MKEVPVLIAGGGPVGMTLAKTLASFGIQCMLVEKNPSTTRHPKMDITNSRSMELFRKLGLSKLLREVAVPETNNFDVSWITSLSGHELHRFRYPSVEQAKAIIRERNDGSQPVEPAMRVSQVAIEPVLKQAIDAESTVDARFGVAFEELVQGPDAIIATVKNVEAGRTEKIKCQYLVGCDGQPGPQLRGYSLRRNCAGRSALHGALSLRRARHSATVGYCLALSDLASDNDRAERSGHLDPAHISRARRPIG